MSAYSKLRAAIEALEDAEGVVLSEISRHTFGDTDYSDPADEDEAPVQQEFSVERVAPEAKAKVVPVAVVAGTDFVSEVKKAAKAAGANLSASDEAQLISLSNVISGLKGKSDNEVVDALKGFGAVAIAV